MLEGYDEAWQYVEHAPLCMEDGSTCILAEVEYRDDAPPLFHFRIRDEGGREQREMYTVSAFRVGTVADIELTEAQEADIEEMKRLVDERREAEAERAWLLEENSRVRQQFTELERKVSLKTVVQDRGIRFLVHITRLQNLPSILRHGILPRIRFDELTDEAPAVNDSMRLDGRMNTVSLSISHPNDSLFIRWRVFDYPDATWLVLLLDPRLLWELPCRLFRSNAASTFSGLLNESRAAEGEDLERLFEELDPLYRVTRAELGYGPSDTTNEQAEVMVEGDVPTDYLVSVAVERTGDVNKLERWLQERVGAELIPDIVAAPALFSRRHCFERRKNMFRS